MGRTDYYHDPNAPRANSLVPGASAVVVGDDGKILLQRRSDNARWALPGGTMDIGETIGQAIVREVREETGYEVEPEHVVGIYSDPGHVFAYDDGEVRQQFSVCFACRIVGGQPTVGDESSEVAFFDALEAAREAGDDRLASNSLGHISFVPASEGSFAAAGDYLHGARQHACRAGDQLMTSWLAAVESELHANGGEPARALAALDQAESALATANPGQRPGWFDVYDGTRLAGFQGYAYLKLGRYDAALAVLGRATEGLPAAAVKQRTVFLTDLATVHVRHGDVDEGCRLASTAAGGLAQAGYATSAQRLREFRGLVEPWRRQPAVRELDERLASLAA